MILPGRSSLRRAPWWTDYWVDLDDYARRNRVLLAGNGREDRFKGVQVDIQRGLRPDVVANLSVQLPFCDNAFDGAFGFSVLEHLPDTVAALKEFHRVVRPGGLLVFVVPHFASDSAFQDPTHKSFFSGHTFDYFVEGDGAEIQYDYYAPFKFRYRRKLLMLARPWNLAPGLQKWANAHTSLYEKHFCFVVRPAGLYVELEVLP